MFDVVIIGGGPAGIMAGIFAAQAGAKPILLEKMDAPLRKLKITGKGRCNLTNTAALPDFLAQIGPQSRFLRPAFQRFFNDDTMAFFESIGVPTVVERGGRVFPESNSAVDVARRMVAHAESLGVRIRCHRKLRRFVVENDRIIAVELASGETVPGKAFVLATGGASYPATGSSGEAFAVVEELGHPVTPRRPALVPVETAGETARNLQGLSLVNSQVNVWVDGRKADAEFGELLFTHFGLSGPVILTLSRRWNDAILGGRKVVFSIDLKPALDDPKLDARLQRDLETGGKTKLKNLFKGWLPAKLIPEFLQRLRLDGEKLGNQVTSEERRRLRLLLKDFSFEVTGLRPFSEAIVTAGGIGLERVDPKSMASRLHPNLFFAGEALDLDANTGGYNLQIAFSTGVLAGEKAAALALTSAGTG